MFEFIFGKRNPTRAWGSYDGRDLSFTIRDGALNGFRIGDSLEYVSFLGRSEGHADYSDVELRYYSLGLCVVYDEKDYKITGFHVVYRDQLDHKHSPFAGRVICEGQVIDVASMKLEECERLFGAHHYFEEDEEEIIACYDFASLEWEIEFGKDGQLNRVIVMRP